MKKTIIPTFCENKNILFLGYSATDSELTDLLDTILKPRFLQHRSKNAKGWLINQSDIGDLHNKIANYWNNWQIDFNIHYPWEIYLQKFYDYLNQNPNNS